ncbi:MULTISPECIES: TlpA family protein disulfide reductase [Sphingobacterium]|uniref:TlpA family protein disulfide reductase n=1 Tax=Sphingobacterium TaxID=28453 RepID=UPI0013DB66CB|nr:MULTISPECIES: TlpA disulfide reductase family protein [unclassified Sphingobacterium]
MINFNRGGRELPFGKGEQVNVLTSYQDRSGRPIEQNNKYRLLLPLGRYRSDVVFIVFCVLFSWSLVSPAYGQEAKGLNEVQSLHIGQQVPDEFWTKEHLFFINGDTIRRTLEEHKGKMVVLDFWSSGCGPCLLHQKEIDIFKAAYPNDLAVVMVSSNQSRENYQKLYNFMKQGRFEKAGINHLVSIIEDGYLEKLFRHYAYPSYFWINRSGILQTHTFRNLLDHNYQAPFTINPK